MEKKGGMEDKLTIFPQREDEKMKEKGNGRYATSDFYLACFLKAKGIILSGYERYGRRVTFIFEDCGEIKKLIRDYYNRGTIEVNPFVHAINDLKALVHNV